MIAMKKRCQWCLKDELYMAYHDEEWGVPVHDDKKLFEFLVLESFQAGLSWYTILKKRENFRIAFAQFEVNKVAQFNEEQVVQLMQNAGIIRNKLKIVAAINNSQRFIEIQKEFGSFAKYMWRFVGGETIVNGRKTLKDIPATSLESDAISKDMNKRGFKFIGATTCYAFMQAVGLVNDHLDDCWKKQASS